MGYRIAADIVVALHLFFVGFVVLGGLLVLRWPRLAWFHLPAALWGMGIELVGGICPLTPLENHLRSLGGEAGYRGGFIEHYIMPLLYPEAMTRQTQIVLGLLVFLLNAVVYAVVIRRRMQRRAGNPSERD